MAPRYDEAPEVNLSNLPPEVHHPPAGAEFDPYGQQHSYAQLKPEGSPVHNGGYGAPPPVTSPSYGYSQPSPYGGTYGEPQKQSKKGTICGCPLLVFVLSAIIAVLSVAVIGLAAGTGLEASRASDAESSLAAIKAGGAAATTTVTAPAATSTSDLLNSLDKNCTSNSDGVTGTTYTSHFFSRSKYTIYCNMDTPLAPMQSLFVGNFDDCMDACSSWTFYTPTEFTNGSAVNQTCAGVSFIPAWTNRTTANAGTAPGNCYLKGGPQNETALYYPLNGQETHAAITGSSS